MFTAGRQVLATDLGPAQPIDETAARYQAALRDPSTPLPVTSAAGRDLHRLVIAPIGAGLVSAQRLLFSPDGALNNVPLGTLAEGNITPGERYLHSYLTSGRDLLRRGPVARSSREVVVFADPSFEATPAAPPPGQLALGTSQGHRGLRVGRLPPLPGTKEEAVTISRLFPQARLFLKDAATESALLGLTSPALLHIATHGFFVEDDDAATRASTRSSHSHFSEREPAAPSNPLLRSALILAGAGVQPASSDASDLNRPDGIVTALEMAGMNLWGTQLVVLSACNSGRGVVKTSQGVYGLRRAIITAGAEALVTSLWKVDDVVTKELMTVFYEQLKAGVGRAPALAEAAQQIRRSHPHPYYWAAFILIGEGGPWCSRKRTNKAVR